MDAKFHPAIAAIKTGDLEKFRELLNQDRSLATSRSSRSHPTLLQCLVLSGNNIPNKTEMAKILITDGAELNRPLIACGCCDNVDLAQLLLDSGASINGAGGWSPLEEALYWNGRRVIDLLVRRGATVHNLRIAAGLGRTDLIAGFFNSDGSLKSNAGKIDWPFGDLPTIENGNIDEAGKHHRISIINAWIHDRQHVIDNAFIYACIGGHIDAARLLLEKGADINAVPDGFDFRGTGLHYAALNGQHTMVEFLIQRGADPNIKDLKANGIAASWAEYGGHPEIKDYLLCSKQDGRVH